MTKTAQILHFPGYKSGKGLQLEEFRNMIEKTIAERREKTVSGVLVAYFSITGVTENAACRLARAISADLYEIIPQKPCREADPQGQEITFLRMDLSAYDVIYVGLPIWWYAAPTVIQNFLSGYDLTGKTLIPFVTSGGGGLDKVRPRLRQSCPGAQLREASLLSEDMSPEELARWAESMR